MDGVRLLLYYCIINQSTYVKNNNDDMGFCFYYSGFEKKSFVRSFLIKKLMKSFVLLFTSAI
jgi:hypothetical protein